MKFRQFSETKCVRGRGPAIHTVDVGELAAVADALLADGRSDLAAQIIVVMYYCAERQSEHDEERDNIVPFRNAGASVSE